MQAEKMNNEHNVLSTSTGTPSLSYSGYYDLNERSVLLYKKEVGDHAIYTHEQELAQCERIITAQQTFMGELCKIPGILVNLASKNPTGSRYDRDNVVIGFNSIQAKERFHSLTRAKAHLKMLATLFVENSSLPNREHDSYKEARGQLRRALFEYRLHPNLHRFYADKCCDLNRHVKRTIQSFKQSIKNTGVSNHDSQVLVDYRIYGINQDNALACLKNDNLSKAYMVFADSIADVENTLHASIADVLDVCLSIPKLQTKIASEVNVFAAHNYKLVLDYAYSNRGRGLDYGDIIQDGNIGLLRAIERFDPYKGVRFSTYGVNWITQSMQRSIEDNGRLIRIPVNLQEKQRKIARACRQAELDGEKVSFEQQLEDDDSLSTGAREGLRAIPSQITSIHQPIADDKVLGDTLVDEEYNVEDDVTESRTNTKIAKALEILNDKQRISLLMYFGLLGYEKAEPGDIANQLNVGKMRVHQLIKEATTLLRENSQDLFELWTEST